MSNDVTLFGGNTKISLGGDAKRMAGALKQSSDEGALNQLPDGGVYISFSGKMGTYSIGTEKEDADPEEIWLVNIYAFEKGWMCWKNSQPLAKRFASIYGEPIPTPDFNEHSPFKDGEGWAQAKALTVRSIDRGMQGYYSTSTKSAVNEMAKLEGEVARRLEEGEPSWPLIHLKKEKFTAQGNTNSKPIFEIYGWLGDAQIEKMSGMGDIEEISEGIDDLIAEAELMVLNGGEPVDEPTADVDDAPKKRKKDKADKPRRRRAAV